MLTERIIKIVCQIWFKKIKRKMSQINFIINVLTFRRFSINKRVTILKVNMNNYITVIAIKVKLRINNRLKHS